MSCSCGSLPSLCTCAPCPSFGGGCPVDPDPLRIVTKSTAEGEPVRDALRGDAVVFEVVVQRSPTTVFGKQFPGYVGQAVIWKNAQSSGNVTADSAALKAKWGTT